MEKNDNISSSSLQQSEYSNYQHFRITRWGAIHQTRFILMQNSSHTKYVLYWGTVSLLFVQVCTLVTLWDAPYEDCADSSKKTGMLSIHGQFTVCALHEHSAYIADVGVDNCIFNTP